MKSSPRRPKTKVFYFLLRLILAGLFLSTLLYMAGPFYIRFFLPLISYEIEILNPEYDIREFYLDDENQIMYQIRVDRVGFSSSR